MEKDFYNLTIPQESIWLSDKYTASSNMSNISGTFYLKDKVNIPLLTRAIKIFIEKNDILNISLTLKDGVPYQYLNDSLDIDKYIHFNELSSLDELHVKEKDWINVNLMSDNKALFNFNIYILNDGTGGFNVILHHIISDAWSMSILVNEIVLIYENLLKDISVSNLSFPSYFDYIEKENNYFLSEKSKNDAIYWENSFKSSPHLVSFSNNVNIAKNTKANRYVYHYENSKKLSEFCANHKISVFSFLMAVYSLYLYKVSDKVNDIILGTPVLNRNGVKDKNTMGMFVNTLPCIVHVENDYKFMDLVNDISKNLFSLFRHHKYPYSKILKHVREEYNFSNNLFDTIVSFQNAKDSSKSSGLNYSTSWIFPGSIANSLNIHIYDMDDDGIFQFIYDYQLEKFNDDEIINLNDRFVNIIEQILSNDDINISDIQIVGKKELSFIESLNDNATKYDSNKTLIDMFEDQVKKTPNNVALVYENKSLTYLELHKKVNKLSNLLLSKGVSPKEPIILLVERSLEMVISMLATLKVGCYYIAIDPYWPKDRIDFIINNSGSKNIMLNYRYLANYENQFNCIYVECIDLLENDSDLPNVSKPSDLAYILYTSGSTGEPKGTLITNSNVVGLLNATNHIFNQKPSDVWTLFHTYTFDFSTWEIYGSLLYGSKLVVVPKKITTNPKEFLNLIIKEKVTILNQTPAFFYKVIEQEKVLNISSDSLNIRYVILGGEAVQSKPLKYFKNKYPNITIYNGYGPTETTVFAIMGEITADDILNNDIAIGRPISNYKVHILDNNLNPLPVGSNGEICISGPGVCNGYYKKPELTRNKFLDSSYGYLYKSGDVGYIDHNGRIYYSGRNDNQVKIRGFRIELDEIVNQISNCEFVKKAVVVPVDNANYTKTLVAFFEADKPNIEEQVLETIKHNLTSYMIPKLFQVDEFPINNNGKIDIKYLIETKYKNSNNKKVVLPKNDIEKDILTVLKSITGEEHVSTDSDFYDDLGMDSLTVMEFSTKLFKYNVEIQDINEYPTVQKLAEKILNNVNIDYFENKLQKDIKISKSNFKFDMSNVLLTGSTGFLGSHLMFDLLHDESVKHIYCLIRKKYNVSVENRLQKVVNNYFPNFDLFDLIAKKLIIIDGNFELDNLGLDDKSYTDLTKKITTVIHAGANVRHYGKYKTFYVANVQSTKNIVKFCLDSSASLAHVSTISVGGYSHISDNKIITEDIINIDQKFRNHVYMVTKYEAECAVLSAVEHDGLNAKIFRLGNIMPRLSDSKFQMNMHQNGFLSRIKTILDINATTNEINNIKIDISPVDVCSNMILKLMKCDTCQSVFHISNPNLFTIKSILDSFNVNLELVDIQSCINLIKDLNDPLNAHLFNDLLASEYIETPFSTDITVSLLKSLDLDWPKIDDDYLYNLYKLINKI